MQSNTIKTAGLKIENPLFGKTTFTGTARELTDAKVKVNGSVLDPVGLSILSRYGVVQVKGQADKGQGVRGRNPTIYELKSQAGFEVTT